MTSLLFAVGCDDGGGDRMDSMADDSAGGSGDDSSSASGNDSGGSSNDSDDGDGNDSGGDPGTDDDPAEPLTNEQVRFYLAKLAPFIAGRSLSFEETELIEAEGEAAIATLIDEWTMQPEFAEAIRDMVANELRVSGTQNGIDYELPGNLAAQLVREDLPWSALLTAEYCVDAAGNQMDCDTGAPYEAGVFTTRAFMLSNKGRFNLGRAKRMLEVFACRAYPMETEVQIPLEKEVLIEMFRAETPEEQTVEEAEGGFGNGSGCYTCHSQFGAHAQLFVKYDDQGLYRPEAGGQQDPEGELGRSFDGLYTSHFDNPAAAAEEATQIFGQPVSGLQEAGEVITEHPFFYECQAKNLIATVFGLEAGASKEIADDLVESLSEQILQVSPTPTMREIVTTVFNDERVIRATVEGLEESP